VGDKLAGILAEDIELWLSHCAADGFNIMGPALLRDLATFVEHVLPLWRARGLVREEYEGATLREHHGLEGPANRFVAREQVASASARS
jgi:hypothetical protein